MVATMRGTTALLLALVALSGAASAQSEDNYDCDGSEGYDTYSEMVTETDECGETKFEDSCGAHVTLNDNDVLDEMLGACSGSGGAGGSGNYAYEGVSPPNMPEVLATMGCDMAKKAAHVRFSWVAPNGNGADVDRFEVSVWSTNNDMVRSYAPQAADFYRMADGSFRLVENDLKPGSYRAHVKAFNSAGQSADGVSPHVEVAAPRPPATAVVSAWGEAGEVHVKAVSGNAADVCNNPSSYAIKVFAAGANADGSDDVEVRALDMASGAMEHVFTTSSDTLAEQNGHLANGKAYRFTVTASSALGTAAPSARSAAVLARDAPTTPAITYCADGGFGCKRTDNCTGALAFNWAAATARGAATDRLTYTVRAYLDGAATPAQTVHSAAPALALTQMGWALGKELRFEVRATASWGAGGAAGSYSSAWSDLTPATALTGPARTPAIAASVKLEGAGAGHDAVTVSWKTASLRWFPGEPAVKRFTVKGVGSMGEASAVICAVEECRPGMAWPDYCENARCSEEYVFSGQTHAAIRYDKWDAAGIAFSVVAQAAFHSNCAAAGTYEHAVFLVGPPAPPAAVSLAARTIRSSAGGALVVSFAPSAGAAVASAPVTAYRVELFSDDIGYGAQKTGEIAVPAGAAAPVAGDATAYTYTFSGLQNGMRYYAKVSAKNRRDWGVPSKPSNMLDPMPVTYLSVTGGALRFDDVSVAQFNKDPAVREQLTASVAKAVSTASTVAVSAGQVTITDVKGQAAAAAAGTAGGRRLLLGTTLVVSFDIDIPILPDASGATSLANNYAATHAADLISLMLENNGPSFMDALKAELRASQFDFVPSALDNSGIDKKVHENAYDGPRAYAGGAAGDGQVQGLKTKGVAGMSSYAFALLLCGVGVTVLGTTLAVMARRRTLQVDSGMGNLQMGKTTPGAMSAGGQAADVLGSPVKATSSFGVAGAGWQRASIKAPMQLGGGTETSFFESDLTDDDEEEDAMPEDFINPALAKHNAANAAGKGGAKSAADVAEAAKRQALRKTSHQFMKSGSKKNLKRGNSAKTLAGKGGADKATNPMGMAMGGLDKAALPDDGAESEFGSL
jgi:hypothetical protein